MIYGLTATGFVRKPASEIKSDIISNIRKINGLQNARINTGSVLGQLVDVFTNELSAVWEASEARSNAVNPDEATGASLDAALALVGKSRNGGIKTSLPLTLWTFSGFNVSIPSGNQVLQSSTEIVFETVEDAVIPGAVHSIEDLVIDAIEWQADNTIRYTFGESPDLSDFVVGDLFVCQGASFESNNLAAKITDVNDGSDYIEVLNPDRTDDVADESGSDAKGFITDAYIDGIPSQAVDIGEFGATAQSIDLINTPVADWAGVVNLVDGVTGRDIETDDDFRARAYLELIIAQGGTLEAIKARLRSDVAGVTYAAGIENRTAGIVDSNAPHSYRLTVVGGLDHDVINMIGEAGGAGIETNGAVSGIYTDPEGVEQTIRFDRVAEIKPFLIVNLTTNANYPATGDDDVKDVLAAIEFAHGDDILNYLLIAAVAAVPGILSIEILQGLSDPPTVSTNTSISPTELAVIDPARITVNS
jgi:uncharacterized phage protein gp47/JayE